MEKCGQPLVWLVLLVRLSCSCVSSAVLTSHRAPDFTHINKETCSTSRAGGVHTMPNPNHALSADAIIAMTASSGAGRSCRQPFTQRCIIEMLIADVEDHGSSQRLFGVDSLRIRTVVRTGRANEQLEMVRELIAGGADVDTHPKVFQGASPVMVAASMGDMASLQILLHAGARPDGKLATGLALHVSALMLAAGQGHDDAVRMLIEHGADVHQMGMIRQDNVITRASPMMWAARLPSLRTLNLLVEAGADIDRQFSTGATLLSWFATHGSSASVRALIGVGADTQVADKQKRTPLMRARGRRDEQGAQIVKMLLSTGQTIPAQQHGRHTNARPLGFSSAAMIHPDAMTMLDASALGVVALALAFGCHSRGARDSKQRRPLSLSAAKARKIASASTFGAAGSKGARGRRQSASPAGRYCSHDEQTLLQQQQQQQQQQPPPQPQPKPKPKPKRQQSVLPSLAAESALSSSGWSSESHMASDVRGWSCEQVAMWAAAAVPAAFASYIMRLVDGEKVDGKALCALNCSRATRLITRGTDGLSCPMSPAEAAESAKCLLDRRDALLGTETTMSTFQPAPDRFFCSLTLEVMKDPVRTCTGQVYERQELTQWLRCNLTPRCPNTNLVLKSKVLEPVPELKGEIEAWRAAQGAAPPIRDV